MILRKINYYSSSNYSNYNIDVNRQLLRNIMWRMVSYFNI